MKKIAFVVCLISSSLIAQAQNISFGKVDLSIGLGGISYSTSSKSLADYRALLPNSAILSKDYSDFVGSNYQSYQYSTMLSILYGLRLGNSTEKLEHRMRVGFSYSNIYSGSSSYYKQTTTPYDTLTSSRTGEQTVIDSINSQNLYMDLSQDMLSLDISYIIRANPNGRWSFYTGLGLELGVGINTRANIYSSEYNYANGPFYFDINNDENSFESESYSLDPSYSVNLYLPIGLDFRLSKSNEFWKRAHLYTELRPGVRCLVDAAGDTQTFVNLGFSALGLRFEF